MPLLIFTILLLLVFAGEGLYFSDRREQQRMELKRYYDVEHPRRETSDRYLDLLG